MSVLLRELGNQGLASLVDRHRAQWLWDLWLVKGLLLENFEPGDDRELVKAAIDFKLRRVGPPPAYLKPESLRKEVTT